MLTRGRAPHFVKTEPPSDADITAVVQKISPRVVRTLRRLGYLEVGHDAPAAGRLAACQAAARASWTGERLGGGFR